MQKQAITLKNAAPSVAPLSPGIKAGQMLFVSGQVAVDPKTGRVVAGGIREQTEQVLKNLQSVLAAAGASTANVVRTTCYLTDMGNFKEFNEVYRSFFTEPFPARTTVEVSKLAGNFVVEVDAIAVLGE